MFRRVCSAVVLGLTLASAGLSADEGRSQGPASKPGWSGKRVAWTVVGAAAGFGAGVFLGLHAFDDAINSDRKVWTTAIAGAAAGGVAGAFLGRDVARTPRLERAASRRSRGDVPKISWEAALRGTGSRGAGLGSEHTHDR